MIILFGCIFQMKYGCRVMITFGARFLDLDHKDDYLVANSILK